MTETCIVYDWDATPGEPAFIDICLRCEGHSNYLEIESNPNQKQLNFIKEGGKHESNRMESNIK